MIKFNSNRGGVQWFRYLWLFINSVKMIFSLGIAGYVSNVHSIISVIRVSFYRFIPIDASTGYSKDPVNDLLFLSMVTPGLSPVKRKTKKENRDFLTKRECVL